MGGLSPGILHHERSYFQKKYRLQPIGLSENSRYVSGDTHLVAPRLRLLQKQR